MENEYLTLKEISKEFPGVCALDNVTLTVKKGEIRALVGENGAGKSTLIKILSGAYQADRGEIIFDGVKSQYNDPIHALEQGIGTIYQEFNLIPSLTVGENIMLGHVPKKGFQIDYEKMHQTAAEAIEKLGLTLNTYEKVANLTVAQQQIVEIAKIIARHLRILIMDEPTAALNEIEIDNLFKVIRVLKKQGITILYISHRLKEIFEIADSVTVLKDGKVVGTKQINDISREELVRMMIGRKIDDYFPEKGSGNQEAVLEIKDLWFKDRVCGVNLSLKKGEILGLAGLEGQGQGELVRVIIGLLKRDKGKIYRKNHEIDIKSPIDAKAAGIGYISDDRKQDGLVLVRSVYENISLPSIKKRNKAGIFINFKAENKFVGDFIRKLSIKVSSPFQIANFLSGGNQQKVVLSKWLGTSPEILIVAEPTRGIDVNSKREIHFLLRDLAKSGVAILMSSCELPELLGMSDRILVMTSGKIVDEFSSRDATEEKIMAAATRDVKK